MLVFLASDSGSRTRRRVQRRGSDERRACETQPAGTVRRDCEQRRTEASGGNHCALRISAAATPFTLLERVPYCRFRWSGNPLSPRVTLLDAPLTAWCRRRPSAGPAPRVDHGAVVGDTPGNCGQEGVITHRLRMRKCLPSCDDHRKAFPAPAASGPSAQQRTAPRHMPARSASA